VLLGGGVKFLLAEDGEGAHLADDLTHVADGEDHIAGARFAFVRIMAAPSAMRRRASPRLRAPQTKACEGVLVN